MNYTSTGHDMLCHIPILLKFQHRTTLTRHTFRFSSSNECRMTNSSPTRTLGRLVFPTASKVRHVLKCALTLNFHNCAEKAAGMDNRKSAREHWFPVEHT